MPAVKIDRPPSRFIAEIMDEVRRIRRESGFTISPPTCLRQICHLRLEITEDDRHEVLSRLARLGAKSRQARVHSNRHVEEKGTMLPLLFVTTVKTDNANKGSTFVTLPTQPKQPQVTQEELFPSMTRGYQDRPHHWPRRR